MQIKLAEHWCYLRENRISNVATWLLLLLLLRQSNGSERGKEEL